MNPYYLLLNRPVSFNSIDQNYNNPSDNGAHSLEIKRQITTKASNEQQLQNENLRKK